MVATSPAPSPTRDVECATAPRSGGNAISKAFSFITLRDPASYREKADAFGEPDPALERNAAGDADPRSMVPANSAQMTESESLQIFRFLGAAWEVAQIEDGVRTVVRALKRKPGDTGRFSRCSSLSTASAVFRRAATRSMPYRAQGAALSGGRPSLSAPNWHQPRVLFPASDGGRQPARGEDALYVSVRDGAQFRLFPV